MGSEAKRRTREDIQRIARQALKDHGLYSVPVSPVRVAQSLGVRLLNAVFSEPKYSGLTAKRDGVGTILIRQLDSPARKRFTIAHELGHALLHLDEVENEIVDTDADFLRSADEPAPGWSAERRREYEANLFAAELLMPSELVVTTWQQMQPDERTLEHMSFLFQVSEAAMGIRLKELGLV